MVFFNTLLPLLKGLQAKSSQLTVEEEILNQETSGEILYKVLEAISYYKIIRAKL